MQLIIAGSPTFTDSQHLCQVLAPDRHRLTQVLTGRARGAEQLGYRWAWKHLVKHQLVRAEWARFGKTAGVRRHHQLAQAGDVLLVFGDGQAPGTAHLMPCMQALGKPVVVVPMDATASTQRSWARASSSRPEPGAPRRLHAHVGARRP